MSAPSSADARVEFHELYEALRNHDERNAMICDDVVSAVNQGRSPLVLTNELTTCCIWLSDSRRALRIWFCSGRPESKGVGGCHHAAGAKFQKRKDV